MKLNPHFSAIGNFICELDRAGADGFVLFNRFYQPDIDLVSLRLRRDLELSTPMEIRLPLLWIGVLRAMSEARWLHIWRRSAEQVIKYLLVGAHAVHDDFGAPAAWRRPDQEARGRSHAMARRTRNRLYRGYSRHDEPASNQRSNGVRARELHSNPRGLEALKIASHAPFRIRTAAAHCEPPREVVYFVFALPDGAEVRATPAEIVEMLSVLLTSRQGHRHLAEASTSGADFLR